jgi:hypothetical protein
MLAYAFHPMTKPLFIWFGWELNVMSGVFPIGEIKRSGDG